MTAEFLIDVHTFLKFSFRLDSIHQGCRVYLSVWDLDSPGESSDCFFCLFLIHVMIRFVLIEFNEFIFDNFKDEVEIYKDGSIFPIKDLSKIGSSFRGRFATDKFNDYHFFEKKQLYMAIPPYLFEMFSDLKTTT